jgi:hypothetical protein
MSIRRCLEDEGWAFRGLKEVRDFSGGFEEILKV